jgi:hypothetical protein
MQTKHIVFLSFLLFSLLASAADPPLKAICTPDKSTGFNWKSGQWVQANFLTDRKLLVEKLDLTKYKNLPRIDSPISCIEAAQQSTGDPEITKACYLIRKLGTPAHVYENAQSCTEYRNRNQLLSIQCPSITFHPDGGYIELPWHADIRPKPPDNYKDSLILSVGTCTRLAQ